MIFSPLVGALLIMCMRSDDHVGIRRGALMTSLVTFGMTVLAVFAFYDEMRYVGDVPGGFVLNCVISQLLYYQIMTAVLLPGLPKLRRLVLIWANPFLKFVLISTGTMSNTFPAITLCMVICHGVSCRH